MIYNGCSTLIGASLGDSMGSYCEFTDPDERNCKNIWTNINPIFNTARGQLTDDTEMANSMALGILESLSKFGINSSQPNNFKTNFIAYYYSYWLSSGPFDIGNTTYNALNIGNIKNFLNIEFSDNRLISKIQSNSKSLNSSSLSNGFLMRHTPMTILLYYFFELNENNTDLINFKRSVQEKRYENLFLFMFDFISSEISLTHHNLECVVASVIYDFLILNILTNKKQEDIDNLDALNKDHLVSLIDFLDAIMKSTVSKIQDIKQYVNKISKNLKTIDDMNDFEKEKNESDLLKVGEANIGYYMHAINLTFFILKFLNKFSTNQKSEIYRNVIDFICNRGGDTDTNCCIVGGVIGSIIGIKNIDNQYLQPHLKFNPRDYSNNVERDFIYAPSVLTLYGIKLYSVLNNQKNNENDSQELRENNLENVSLSMIKNILTRDLEKEAKRFEPIQGRELPLISHLI